MRHLLLALVVLVPVAAAAQPLAPAPAEASVITPAVAVGTSVLTTAAAIGAGLAVDVDDGSRAVLIVLGAAVGPSAGNLIQGEWGDAGIGLGIRTGGAVILLGAAAGAFWNDSEAQRLALGGVAIVGGLVGLSGVAYDVATAGTNASSRRVELAPTGTGVALRVGL